MKKNAILMLSVLTFAVMALLTTTSAYAQTPGNAVLPPPQANNNSIIVHQLTPQEKAMIQQNLQDFLKNQQKLPPGTIFMDHLPPIITFPLGSLPANVIASPSDSPQVQQQKGQALQQFIQAHPGLGKISGAPAHELGPKGFIPLPNGTSIASTARGLLKTPTQVLPNNIP